MPKFKRAAGPTLATFVQLAPSKVHVSAKHRKLLQPPNRTRVPRCSSNARPCALRRGRLVGVATVFQVVWARGDAPHHRASAPKRAMLAHRGRRWDLMRVSTAGGGGRRG